MERQNELLKQTLIKQYSQLINTSEVGLTQQISQPGWWNEEQDQIKKQSKRTLRSARFSYVCLFLVIISGIFNLYVSTRSTSVPFYTLLTLSLLSFGAYRNYSFNNERIKLFEIMQLAFGEKEMLIDSSH
jgi:hypothetical protein